VIVLKLLIYISPFKFGDDMVRSNLAYIETGGN